MIFRSQRGYINKKTDEKYIVKYHTDWDEDKKQEKDIEYMSIDILTVLPVRTVLCPSEEANKILKLIKSEDFEETWQWLNWSYGE